MGADGSCERPQGPRRLTTGPAQHSQFYGRRTTRPPRPGRAAALEACLPHYAITLDDIPGMFADNQPRWLEIGFGSGEHLLAQARRHPGTGMIGCEPFLNGVSALMKELQAAPQDNIRVFIEDARFLLKALPDCSIARCFILFADPWPKKRHHKRRIVNADTLDDLARILMAEGQLFLATDDPGLAQWYEEIVGAHPAFTFAGVADAQTRPEDWPLTRYEEKAFARGKRPFYYLAQLEVKI